MLGKYWYHGLVRKYVTIFGSIFNDISIVRTDTNGESVQNIVVPVMFGPKERYLARQDQNEDLLRPVSLLQPTVSFNLTGLRYDPKRKLNSLGYCTTGSSNSGTLKRQMNPVPYILEFTLSIVSRNTDDSLQILEQILPFFSPTLMVSANLIPEMNYQNTSLPITLMSISHDDFYEGSFESKEYIEWTLVFELQGYFYGPIGDSKIIKEVTVNFPIPTGDINTSGLTQEHIYIRPGLTANGEPTTNVNNSVALSQISKDDNYGIIIDVIRDADG